MGFLYWKSHTDVAVGLCEFETDNVSLGLYCRSDFLSSVFWQINSFFSIALSSAWQEKHTNTEGTSSLNTSFTAYKQGRERDIPAKSTLILDISLLLPTRPMFVCMTGGEVWVRGGWMDFILPPVQPFFPPLNHFRSQCKHIRPDTAVTWNLQGNVAALKHLPAVSTPSTHWQISLISWIPVSW